jgi:hypothetical protein
MCLSLGELVFSNYDEQTLCAVAYLNNNNGGMNCFKLTSLNIGSETYLNAEKLLLVAKFENYYVNLLDKSVLSIKNYKDITRRTLPKIKSMKRIF